MLIAETVAIVGKRYNIPVVMDMAENYPACMRTFLKYNSSAFSRFLMHKVRLPDIVERRAVGLCDGIVVVCDEQINRLNQQYNYPKDNIAVAQNTPILQDFSTIIPSVVNIQHKMSNNNQINFTSHGYLSAEKPLDNFILGFNKIAERYNINLTIAGMGECFEGLKNLIQSLENRNKIQLTGAYDYSTLPQIINNTDIGVIPFPADDQTNFTIHNKLFEYMIGGKPVLVGNSQPFQRIINETKVGLSMDFSTSELSAIAIEKMLQQDTEQMSKNCLHFIKTKYN
jgi:glycosyltransferase involved in cell wall biosynthesis